MKGFQTRGGMGGFEKEQSTLNSLAQSYGIQVAYTDVLGKRRKGSRESILGVLAALGVPVEGISDVAAALRDRKKSLIDRRIEPVAVAWNGKVSGLLFYFHRNEEDLRLELSLRLESGEKRTWNVAAADCRPLRYENFEESGYVARELDIPETLPFGVHTLTIEAAEGSFATSIICAPEKNRLDNDRSKMWGVFIPLYSLHSDTSLGAGDFGDLAKLYRWVDTLGGNIVGTLPFLAAFLDNPCEPSPYSPASRLFWNEFYLELKNMPGLEVCDRARALLESARNAPEDPRSASLVDYRRQMAVRRAVLEELARCFFSRSDGELASFKRYLSENPLLGDYARFRALGEKLQKPWPEWAVAQREGVILSADVNKDAENYHLYVQWMADRQLSELSKVAERSGPGLYLDLPLGIHPHAYDTWRYRDIFPQGVSGGAPPDVLFTGGQNWGFPPMHPEKIREDGYSYVFAFLKKMMRRAGVLRIDHVPGLHRIYWIPDGLDASQGIYVRYNADEMYAILNLEAYRNKCVVVGENLGTVPDYVNDAMSRHNVLKMYVVQYELEGNTENLKPVPANSISCLNTHDMPTFAGFLEGNDIADRVEAGILDREKAPGEEDKRRTVRRALEDFLVGKGLLGSDRSEGAILRAALEFLAGSRGELMLVNLEDLWLEKFPQNLPGTGGERPNWKRRARHSLEEYGAMPEVVEVLNRINDLRNKSRKKR